MPGVLKRWDGTAWVPVGGPSVENLATKAYVNDVRHMFKVLSASYDSGGDQLQVQVSNGKIRWGDFLYELAAAGGSTQVTMTPVTESTTYYVTIEPTGSSAGEIDIHTHGPATVNSSNADRTYLASITTGVDKSVSSVTDLRGLLTPDNPRVRDGNPVRPGLAWQTNRSTGIGREEDAQNGDERLFFTINGTRRLHIDDGGLRDGSFDRIQATRLAVGGLSANQSIAHSTSVTVAWDSFDNSNGVGLYTPSGGVVTVSEDGWYRITSGVCWDTPATTGWRFQKIVVNTSTDVAADRRTMIANSESVISRLIKLNANDTVKTIAFHNEGTAIDLQSNDKSFFSIEQVQSLA